MNRFIAIFGALFFAFISVSSACFAAEGDLLQFSLDARRGGGGEIQASFRDPERRGDHFWSSGLAPAQLAGLDVGGLHAAGTRPVRFALVREPGRLDCAGTGGSGRAAGNCRFTPDSGFLDLLGRRGIGRPDRKQMLGLMALDARRAVIEALAAARYPTPTIDQLMAVTALGVDANYIRGLAAAGYRPASIDTLVEFKALGITPEWIGGFARIGRANLPSGDLVQLKALGVTPEYVLGFDRAGYPNLPAGKLVELKALGITPEFARSMTARTGRVPPVAELVELKLFGRTMRR